MGSRLLVTYRFACEPAAARARALGIALEQSTELPAGAEPEAIHALGLPGRVEEIRPECEPDASARPARFLCVVSYPADLVTPGNPAALLNVLFGNTSLQNDVELVDAKLPAQLLAPYAGPGFGIEGLRRRLAATGPITCTALKPVGVGSDDLAGLAARFARAGIHLIKDDHGFVDQRYAPLAARVRACGQAVAAAEQETSRPSLYAPHLCGTLDEVRGGLELCARTGVGAVMMAPMLVGLPAFAVAAAEAASAGIVVLAHLAYTGAVRVAPEFLLGGLFRLLGADGVIFVNYGGRFGAPPDGCRRLAHNLRRPWGAFRPALPLPAGGMTVARVPEMVDFYGDDVGLLVSGALYPDDGGLEGRARALVDAARQCSKSGPANK